jgi:hypothetical protein
MIIQPTYEKQIIVKGVSLNDSADVCVLGHRVLAAFDAASWYQPWSVPTIRPQHFSGEKWIRIIL